MSVDAAAVVGEALPCETTREPAGSVAAKIPARIKNLRAVNVEASNADKIRVAGSIYYKKSPGPRPSGKPHIAVIIGKRGAFIRAALVSQLDSRPGIAVVNPA